jgi:hypothetical protein
MVEALLWCETGQTLAPFRARTQWNLQEDRSQRIATAMPMEASRAFRALPCRTAISTNPWLPTRASASPGGTTP